MTIVAEVGLCVAVVAAGVALIVGLAELFARDRFGAGMAVLGALVAVGLLMVLYG